MRKPVHVRRFSHVFNYLCNGNIFAKFVTQTLVWTAGAAVWLGASEFAFRIHLTY